MSDVQPAQSTGPKEIDLLRQRAKLMGVAYKDADTADIIKAAIDEKNKKTTPVTSSETTAPNALEESKKFADSRDTIPAVSTDIDKPVKKKTLRQRIYDENMRLVRVRITNLDPKKKDLPGEVLTVANEYLGTVKKFIPYGEQTEDGFHIPWVLYKFMKARRFLNIRVKKDRRTGTNHTTQSWVHEFALEILPALTENELRQLGSAQMAAGSIESLNGEEIIA